MTDIISMRVKFTIESDAMETQMDIISRGPTINLPDPLNSEHRAAFCDILKTAMVHRTQMGEAFSTIKAIYTQSIDPTDSI